MAAAPGGGNCFASDVYSTKWASCIVPRYRDLMERQVTIELSGGVAEAIHRGMLRGREALRFAEVNCGIGRELEHAEEVLRDIFRLTGYRVGPQHYADRTLALLEAHWPAVEALADALVDERRIEGRRVLQIIDRGLRVSRTSGEHVKAGWR